MSTLKIDEWQQVSGFVPQTLVQFVPVSSNPVSSVSTGTLVNISASYGGNTLGFNYEPQYNTGISVGTVEFAPRYSDSIIVLHTSHMAMSEKTNVSDDFRISAFAENALLGWRSSGLNYSAFSSNLNAAHFHLHIVFNSWGTSNKTIDLRVDASGANSNYYHFNGAYNNTSAVIPPIQWYLMEFKQ